MLVCVSVPSRDGPSPFMMSSLLAEQLVCRQAGVDLLLQWVLGIPYVQVARNQLAKMMLETEVLGTKPDACVFIDDDESWKPGGILKLLQSPHDVIGGTYRPKEPSGRFHVDAEPFKPEKHGDLWKVAGLPGGFMKITRRAFERLETRQYLDYGGNLWRDFFPCGYLDGQRFYQEDYGFCWQWRMQGGEIWLDPSIHIRHHDGIRLTYEGDAAKWMDETYGTTGGSRTESQEAPELGRFTGGLDPTSNARYQSGPQAGRSLGPNGASIPV